MVKINSFTEKQETKYLIELNQTEYQQYKKIFNKCDNCHTLILAQSKHCYKCAMQKMDRTKQSNANKLKNLSRKNKLFSMQDMNSLRSQLKNKGFNNLYKDSL